jgi:hypothetical protein
LGLWVGRWELLRVCAGRKSYNFEKEVNPWV